MAIQQFDKDVLLRYASQDPDILLSDFESYIKTNPRVITGSNIVSDARVDELNTFDALFRGAGPAATGRPGFTSSLTSERLRNETSERGIYEDVNRDNIPLRTYRKMGKDPLLSLGSMLLAGWIGGLDYSIECADEKMKAVVKHAFDDVYASTLRSLVKGGLKYGFSFSEKVWERDQAVIHGKSTGGKEPSILYSGPVLKLRKVKPINPDQSIRYFKDAKKDEIAYIEQQQQSGTPVKVKRGKLVWFALDQEFAGIFGHSRFKNAYEMWVYGKIVYQWLLKHLQKCGSPALEIRHPMGRIRRNGETIGNDQLGEMLGRKFQNHQIAVLPSDRDEKGGYKWSVGWQSVANSDPSPFLKVIELIDRKKLQALGIPPSVLEDGNFSQTDAATDLLLVIVEDIVDQVEAVLQQDIINQITAYNFGPQFVSQVHIRIDRSGLGRRAIFKEIFNNMLRIGNSKKGLSPTNVPDLKALGKELGIPMEAFEAAFMVNEAELGPVDESPEAERQRDEDSNGVHRQTPDTRKRERDSANADATQTKK